MKFIELKFNSNAFSYSNILQLFNSSTMQSSRSSSTGNFRRYWTIYILLLIVIVITNCVLTFFSFVEESLAIKTFTMGTLLPAPIYLLESVFTRDKYIEIFSEVRSIDSILRLSPRKHVMQFTSENVIKIISVLALFVVQLAIIAVKYFIYGSIGHNTRVNDIIMTKSQ